MIAIGLPGQMPRVWFEGPAWLLSQQVREGEVTTSDVRLDADGWPVPVALPVPQP